jgi:acetyl-CoA synthetase
MSAQGNNDGKNIEVLVKEGRTFPPSEAFRAQALIRDTSVYDAAERDYDGFWLERAREFVAWEKEPTRGLH